ncbi:MAG: Sjogren's syndrome/scleroderma autoantigen 1 family protein [Candidatus Nitrosocaldus sp.]
MSKDSMKAAAEMLRKGGTLVKEACSKCKGVQVKYSGRLICINCGNETVLEEARTVSLQDLRSVIIAKVNSTARMLEQEGDIARQMEIARLLLYYLEILAKVGEERVKGEKEMEGKRVERRGREEEDKERGGGRGMVRAREEEEYDE